VKVEIMAKKRRIANRLKSPVGSKRSAQRAFSVATDTKQSVKSRVAAMVAAPLAACENDANLQAMLKVLREQAEPIEVRLAALQALQAASFSVVSFQSCRSDYIATLRKVATDPDAELRQRVLGILAREKDGFAQKKLLDGIQNPDKALVPPEKALQLLSYDVHADAYPVAREIVKNPPNPAAKREALRLLAADGNAERLFEKVLRDKNESQENRQISAAALQTIKPAKLQTHAREMLLDSSEHHDMHALSLTALTQFGNPTAVVKDKKLLDRVGRLKNTTSRHVKASVRRFLSKYAPD
jgi:hypothetical protein